MVPAPSRTLPSQSTRLPRHKLLLSQRSSRPVNGPHPVPSAERPLALLAGPLALYPRTAEIRWMYDDA